MSVVFVNCTSETFTPTKSGAIATVLWELCKAAEEEGVFPMVLSCPADAEPYPWKQTIFVAQPRSPSKPWTIALFRLQRRLNGWRYLRQKAFALRVMAVIRERGLDRLPLIFHNDPEMAVLCHQEFPHARIVHHFHNQHTSKPRMRRLFGQAGIKVTAVSDFIARWAENFHNLPANSVQTIYNGVDTEAFHPAPQQPPGPPVINFAGRTGIEKAPDLLLKAALLVAERRTDFAVQIVGGNHWGYSTLDNYQLELQALSSELQRRGVRVHFTGFLTRNQMPDAFQRVHIHVVPSRWDEPCALTLFEGMASGLAIVASRTGGTPEVVGDAGLLFEKENVAELAAHLLRLIDHPEVRGRLALKSRQRAFEFNWKSTWEGFKAAVRESREFAASIP
jgi:glycosyltransferase involved in cell wall biosynthesis